ncbi:MAG: hypothetical protein WD080_07045 [Egibacteraceae bacterium]
MHRSRLATLVLAGVLALTGSACGEDTADTPADEEMEEPMDEESMEDETMEDPMDDDTT